MQFKLLPLFCKDIPVDAGICSHSDTKISVRSDCDVGGRGLAFQFIPEVSNGVQLGHVLQQHIQQTKTLKPALH